MSGPASRGRALGTVVLVFAAVVVFTGAASPALTRALNAAGATGATLEDVTLRLLELSAILATFPLLAVVGGGGRAAWGVPPRRGLARRVGAGLAIGVASLGVVCAALWLLDVRVTRDDLAPDPGYWLRLVGAAALSAAVIGLMEELWFRGGLFTVLARVGGRAGALWVGAVIYAGAHFLEPAHPPDPQAPAAGFVTLAQAASAVFSLVNLDSFVALLVAGLLLGALRLRQGDVALCIGIHAGWVFTIKVFKKLTYLPPTSEWRWLAGRYDDLIGWLAAAVLAATALLVWRWLERADPQPR